MCFVDSLLTLVDACAIIILLRILYIFQIINKIY